MIINSRNEIYVQDKLNDKINYYNNIISNMNKESKTTTTDSNDENFQKFSITKKTERGRKEKFPLPKNKSKCELCLKFFEDFEHNYDTCSLCGCLFHITCNPEYQENPLNKPYTCFRCQYSISSNQSYGELKCFICGNFMGFLKFHHRHKIFYHQICIDLLKEFKEIDIDDISKDKIKKWRYKNSCRYCGVKLTKDKAVIKCKNPKCHEYYHIPCAILKGMIFDLDYMKKYYQVSQNNEIPFYCSNHNKKISSMYKNYIINHDDCLNNKDMNISDQSNLKEEKNKKTFFENSTDDDIVMNEARDDNTIDNINNKQSKDEENKIDDKTENTIDIDEPDNTDVFQLNMELLGNIFQNRKGDIILDPYNDECRTIKDLFCPVNTLTL